MSNANDSDKLTGRIAGYAMRFVRNDGDAIEDECVIEASEVTENELEIAFSLGKDRYYLRMHKADLRRILKEATTP